MRIRQLEMVISPRDLVDFVKAHLVVDEIADLGANIRGETLQISFTYRVGINVPVEISLRIDEVAADRIRFATSTRLGFPVPNLFAEKVLTRLISQLEIPAISVSRGALDVDLDLLRPDIQAWFRLRDLSFTKRGIEVRMEDFVLVPISVPADLPDAPETEGSSPDPTTLEPEHRRFYDWLRKLLEDWFDGKGPKYKPLIAWLLLLPDLFVLLCRLTMDKRVPAGAKAAFIAAIAYVISPIDLVPDMIPVIGFADDLAVVLLALNRFLDAIPEEVVREHWPGGDLLDIIRNGLQMAQRILDERIWRVLRRRGGPDEGGSAG